MKQGLKHIVALLLMVLVLFAGCGGPNSATYTQVDGTEAQTMMEESDEYVIVDVRTPKEYAEMHVKGAINVPNENIGDEAIAELPDKEQRIFVYCRSGNRSKQASEKLAAMGYSNIVEFGGIKDWEGPTESE